MFLHIYDRYPIANSDFVSSGGGIVAFGIGLKRWSVEEFTSTFQDLAQKAFKKRMAVKWPGLGTLVEARHHSVYKTQDLITVLKSTFGEEPLFGGKVEVDVPHSLKVGVTTTSSNNQAYLLANYNRQTSLLEDGKYYLSHAMKISNKN